MGGWIGDHSLALAALSIYLLLIIGYAWHGHRATRSTADYYVGGRAMGGVPLRPFVLRHLLLDEQLRRLRR